MNKETFNALEIIMEDLAKGRTVHSDAWKTVHDWMVAEWDKKDTWQEDGRKYRLVKHICECGNEHEVEDILADCIHDHDHTGHDGECEFPPLGETKIEPTRSRSGESATHD